MPVQSDHTLEQEFADVNTALASLEQRLAAGEPLVLPPTVEASISLARRLIVARIAADGSKAVPAADADILDAFKTLVKGDPTWTAIRDNLRELVYYRNCIEMGRDDALPAAPEKMAVRTARHVYLYMRTRCVRDGQLR